MFLYKQILGIVGESGSGKSVTSLAILGLLSKNAKVEGKIIFDDFDVTKIKEKELVEDKVLVKVVPLQEVTKVPSLVLVILRK